MTTRWRPAGAAATSEGATTMAPAALASSSGAQLGLRDEGDRVAARRLQRGDACDRLRGVAPQFSAQRRNDLTQAN